VTSHADLPSEAEAGSLDELIADGVVVQHLLDLRSAPAFVPEQRVLRIPVPASALAVVAGLDSYGD
jgi:hypothetical protein